MAEHVPVSDVLCEATEYLCKLGSNLRVRTENLKIKRIRKDKLNNVHAVRKAASKVLLICELSKKSIENVEGGVKKILSKICLSQKDNSNENLEKNTKSQYFVYRSRKVRIKDNINLKHYMSVNVNIPSMSEAVQEKYPVYYNCALYQKRRKEIDSQSIVADMNIKHSRNVNPEGDLVKENFEFDTEQSVPEKDSDNMHLSSTTEQVENHQVSLTSNDNTSNEINTNILNKAKKTGDKNKAKIKMPKKKFKNIKVIETSSSESESCTGEDVTHSETIGSEVREDVETVENLNASYTNTYPVNGVDSIETNKEVDLEKDKSNFDILADEEKEKIPLDKNNSDDMNVKCNSETHSIIENNRIENESLEKSICNVKNDSKSNSSEESNEAKPLIKCVNINKLLAHTQEPNISLVNISDSENELDKKNDSEKGNLNKHTKKKKISRQKRDMKREYLRQQRIEVLQFKSKPFSIQLTRLPKFSENYLIDNNLKKITQNGLPLCELLEKLPKKAKIFEHVNEVNPEDNDPNAMLNDSAPHSGLVEESTQAVSALLKESESDNSIEENKDKHLESVNEKKRKRSDSVTPSKEEHITESMDAKKKLLTCSSGSETEDDQLRQTLEKIRDSLLNGSDDESTINKSGKNDVVESSKETNDKNKVLHCRLSKDDNKQIKSKSEDNEQSDCDTGEKFNSRSKKMSESKSDGIGSSGKNSDTQDSNDKDIDGLTNLDTLNRKRRRRHSSTSESTSACKTRSRAKKNMPKVQPISDEGCLKAEDSSDAVSDAASETAEELPSIPMSGLNGDSVTLLAKDDLLGDSDSSSSRNEAETGSQGTQKEEESSDDNVKATRRKANAISSDSEAGSSRKKDKHKRMSDFEDSGDDTSGSAKKSKRKKKGSESDASATSSVGESKKKRRRIRNVDDSDNSTSESENEGEGKNKHGRKNIRKVMGKNQLEEATKKAARQEKERIARIAERQKLYNNLEFDESGKPDEVVLEKVVLDFDPETKEPLIELDKGLVKKLKPHQANGIKFMWNACFESVRRIKKDKGSGCILAHCMGLGKTLQVVSLTHTLLTHSSLTGVRRVLVVCPLSTVLNWVNEFRMWLKHTHSDYEVDVYELSRFKQNSERAFQLQRWFQGGGVCVLGYEMFRNLSADNVKKFKKKMLRNFQESLVDPGPDLVVCDEGHLLKNEKTSLSQAMNRVCTLRRIVLTGTPLQNNLKEYYCMVQFVKPNLLGKYNEYLNRFVNPITNGQYTDSTEHDIRIMKRRSHVLHKMLDGAVQRRDYGVLAPFLPPKHEYVLFITLSEVQIKLYQEYLDNYSRRPLPGKSSGFLFPDFQSLQRIWTHPLVLKYNSERYEIMQQKKREREEEDSEGSLVDFIDDESTAEETSTDEESDISSDISDDSRKKSKKKKSNKKSKGKDGKAGSRRGTRANPTLVDAEEEERLSDVAEVKYENPTEWWVRLVGDDELEDLRNSHKLVLLFDILRQCEAIGDKLLVFSQSLYSLDLIEHFLGKIDEATQEGRVDEKLNSHVGSWSPGVDYFRLDGSTSCENRSIWCKNFNREDNPRARLFLISTRAGGLGINLVAANRVVIFDVSWNPSHDVQSIFRVYRFGQKKPCYIYRFLAMGTMEEKIYERQVTKQAISKRVIDEQQIDRHYAENDLAELYKFEPRPPAPRELPPLPKDRLFAEMLREHEQQIYKYHEHDSLLENKEEETLTEEERKAAWEDFENEKTRPPPAPFAGYAMHNGMMPGLLAQQQQQLAYAALAAMLRKDMPNINDNQIRDMLPMIYNANPGMFGGYDYGLMQKMSEVYKYAPGMMNPAMMNPIMNAASGMGGSSGLQYEPPWQRQQQQQQQMRLQQLMQQQQNMGAKMYAGGLGSRDPVAMALQQQRARELMLGERSRPRGRPPARATPSASGDVVNLDSD